MRDVVQLPTLDTLRHHVLCALCHFDQLDPQQTPLHERLITRRGKPCGVFFEVHGPRLLKNYAVWASDEKRILYYNASGERIDETRLSATPALRPLAAAA